MHSSAPGSSQVGAGRGAPAPCLPLGGSPGHSAAVWCCGVVLWCGAVTQRGHSCRCSVRPVTTGSSDAMWAIMQEWTLVCIRSLPLGTRRLWVKGTDGALPAPHPVPRSFPALTGCSVTSGACCRPCPDVIVLSYSEGQNITWCPSQFILEGKRGCWSTAVLGWM